MQRAFCTDGFRHVRHVLDGRVDAEGCIRASVPDNQLVACFDEWADICLRRIIERSQCVECVLIPVPGRVLKRVGPRISRQVVLDGGVLKQVLTGLADISVAGDPDSKVE